MAEKARCNDAAHVTALAIHHIEGDGRSEIHNDVGAPK